MNSSTSLIVDVQRPNIATVAYGVQGDSLSRELVLTLIDGDKPWTPPSGAMATVRYVKPDGTYGFYDTLTDGTDAIAITGNVATVILASQALTVPGEVRMELNFYTSDAEKLTTFSWLVMVQPAALLDATFMSTDYYNILSEQIASVLGTEEKIAAVVAGVAKTNLLDNPWFQINQRGEGSYAGAVYGVDRWKSRSSSITVTKNNDGSITLKNTGTSTGYFAQPIEPGSLAAGAYTLSIHVLSTTGTPNDSGRYGSAYLEYGNNHDYSSLVSITSTEEKIYSRALTPPDNVIMCHITVSAGCTITVKAVKLEAGAESTLANDLAPNYLMELLKCQQYYFRIGGKATCANGVGVASSATRINLFIPTPVSLRRTGNASIAYGGGIYAAISIAEADKLQITGFILNSVAQNGIWVTAETSGATKGAAYYLRLEGAAASEAYIDVSKDL